MKKKTAKKKFPRLEKNKNLKIRQELIDYDYIDKLSDEEKEWLNKFTNEYTCGSFQKIKTGKRKGEYSSTNLHKTQAQREECYNRNNLRNNDVHGVSKINNMLKDGESAQAVLENKDTPTASEVENILINLIELKDT